MISKSLRKSFTLIELVIVTTITGIIAMLMFQILDNGLRSWRIQNSQTEIREDARWLLDRMVREIRQAGSVAIPASNRITFTYDEDRNGVSEAFSYQTNGAVLERTRIAATAPVLTNVNAFTATGLTPSQPWIIIAIAVTGREGIQHHYRTSVFPRFNLP